MVRGRAKFEDGSTLRFTLVAFATGELVTVRKYAFHFAGPDKRTVFRYDNTRSHSEIPTHPHHKHVGPDETVVPSGPVTIAQVLGEIREHLRSR